MEDLVEEVCKRMQAGLVPLKDAAATPSGAQSCNQPSTQSSVVKQELAAAAENVKREVSTPRWSRPAPSISLSDPLLRRRLSLSNTYLK